MFDVFLKAALQLGADYVATGHYCRKDSIEISGKETFRLLAGADANKDQSYFLCQLTQEQLKHAVFPIGEMLKPDLREIARKAGLEGRVYLQFIIDERGKVHNPIVVRGIGGGCDEAAIDAIKKVSFSPGLQRGKPVKVKYSLPIMFKLAKSKDS